MVVENARVTLGLADGRRVVLSHLARRTDEFVEVLRTARARARRAALLQWTAGPPIDTYPTRVGGEPGQVVLFPDGVTVEPLNGPPRLAPLPLVEGVERDGYRITLHLRVNGHCRNGTANEFGAFRVAQVEDSGGQDRFGSHQSWIDRQHRHVVRAQFVGGLRRHRVGRGFRDAIDHVAEPLPRGPV